jgi:hypothetical protein
MGRKPAPIAMDSQKTTTGSVTEIISHLGKLGEVIMSERVNFSTKCPRIFSGICPALAPTNGGF